MCHGVLRRAIADGVTPTMAKLVRDTHRLVPWHTDWSSQTGASQLGILHGCNHNVPAFRWYDKTTGTVAVFSNPRDNEQREAERADRPGLLAFDGASRGNLFTAHASGNGVDWVSCGTAFASMGDPTRVGVHALCPGDMPPTTTQFDYFKILKRPEESPLADSRFPASYRSPNRGRRVSSLRRLA